MSGAGRIVVVGAGQAGARVCEGLRREGFAGSLTLVGAEAHLPYERPPLSKDVLLGKGAPEAGEIHDRDFYRSNEVDLRLSTRAVAIDRAAQRVRTESGEAIPYDKLVLALGVRPRPLPLAGATGTLSLRTRDDALALLSALGQGRSLLVIGGGFLGLEVVAAARQLGTKVLLVEQANSLLPRVVAPEIGDFYRRLHAGNGVEIKTGVTVTDIGGGKSAGEEAVAKLGDGSLFQGTAIVAAIGSLPNTDLAESAGLAVRDGILVDAAGRTSDPGIWAAGDCTRYRHPILGREVRLESWHNAETQARVVAAGLCGKAAELSELPWFWSDQYATNLQIVGYPDRWDRIVTRGDPASGRFVAFYLREGKLVAANTINSGRDIRACRELILSGRTLDPAALADPAQDIKKLSQGAPIASPPHAQLA